ncbi:unnamed protein product [Lota lota]
MPVVWPTILDLGRDECKRILRKLELEAYAGVISALRAQGDLTKDKKDLLGELTKILGISTERHRAEVRRAVNDERLTTIAYHMSGPNSASEWSIEGRRLVPLMPRLVPQTAFTVTANAVANATANQNASLLLPAETGNKEVVVCYSYTSTTCTPTSATATLGGALAMKSPRPPSPASNVVVLPSGSTVYVKSVSCSDEDEKPRKRRRTNSSGSSPVVLKEVAKVTAPSISKGVGLPMASSMVGLSASSPKMSNIMQSIANSLPPHLSPVKITFAKPTIQSTSSTTQKVIIVTTSPSSNFVPNILSKSHSHGNSASAAALSKLVSTSMLTAASHKQTVVFPSAANPNTVAVTAMVSSSPAAVMSTIAQCSASAGVKVASARLPSPKTMAGSPTQIMAQFPKQQQQQQQGSTISVSQAQASSSTTSSLPGSKPTIQIKQESGVKIITQQVQPSKILPKPSSVGLSSSSSSPIMVVSSNGAIMSTKLVSQPTATQTTYTRPTVSPNMSARISAAAAAAGATYVKTTSGSIITVVPKSLATLGGKIISSNIVSGTTTKITTIPMTSKPNVIVVQKTTGKGATIQGLPGKNVVTTLLNAGGEKNLQTVQGTKPAIITASRPITKMIVTQPKGMSSGAQATATKIIPTKIVYGQQGKTQVLIKPKPVFQAAVVSEQTRQLVSETLQQASRSSAEAGQSQPTGAEGATPRDETPAGFPDEAPHTSFTQDSQPVVHLVTTREQDWMEQEVVESSPTTTTIIYQDMSVGESQSATSTIKALLELQQQTTVKERAEAKPRQHTIDLSQMAVPLQQAQDKRQAPAPPRPTTTTTAIITTTTTSSEADAAPEQHTAGGLHMNHKPQVTASLEPQRGLVYGLRLHKRNVNFPDSIHALPSPTSVFLQPSVSHTKPHSTLEAGELEGDTLDPQTGLFHRSSQPSAHPQPSLSQALPASSSAPAPAPTPAPAPAPPPPPQLQSRPQISQPSSSSATPSSSSSSSPVVSLSAATHCLVKKLVRQPPPKPTATLTPAPPPPPPTLTQSPKDKLVSAAGQPWPTVAPVTTTATTTTTTAAKPPLTPQLPRLQQAPTTAHHRPIHAPLSQPPPLQAHHPVGTEKSSSSGQQQPIITQSATVTKITFGGSHHSSLPHFGAARGDVAAAAAAAAAKLEAGAAAAAAEPGSSKPSGSDILKISMMEAEIDPSVEPMVVDSSSDRKAPGHHHDDGGATVPATSDMMDTGQLISSTGPVAHRPAHLKADRGGPFGRLQALAAQRNKEDMNVIEVIPQFSILPDSSQSNVVVEPSGFLEITNYTSQQLDQDCPMMEQEVDSSSNDDDSSLAGPP